MGACLVEIGRYLVEIGVWLVEMGAWLVEMGAWLAEIRAWRDFERSSLTPRSLGGNARNRWPTLEAVSAARPEALTTK